LEQNSCENQIWNLAKSNAHLINNVCVDFPQRDRGNREDAANYHFDCVIWREKFSTRCESEDCGPNCSQSGRSTLQMKFSLITINSAAKFINLMRSAFGSPPKRHALRDVKFRPEMSSSGCSRFLFPSPWSIKSSSGRRHAHISPRPADRLANVKMHLSPTHITAAAHAVPAHIWP
jgi:hypothetical protein